MMSSKTAFTGAKRKSNSGVRNGNPTKKAKTGGVASRKPLPAQDDDSDDSSSVPSSSDENEEVDQNKKTQTNNASTANNVERGGSFTNSCASWLRLTLYV